VRPDILIAGQGLAGTLLAWEFERAGISFEIAEGGDNHSATRVAAGIINPITGRRLVKSWGVERFLPAARAAYRELESTLGIPLWRDVRVRRLFAEERERRTFSDKRARGELAPFAGTADEAGFWIEGAARVELPFLLDAACARWRAQGRLRERVVAPAIEASQYALVIDCGGIGGARNGAFDFVPWEFSKGEILTLAVDGLDPGVVLNRGHWVLPLAPGVAAVGATHEPGATEAVPTDAGRAALEESARALLARPFVVMGHTAGVRVNLPDKRPVAGRHPANARLGVLNGLGAKGALLAPSLARQWAQHIAAGVPFDAEVDAARFFARPSARNSSR